MRIQYKNQYGYVDFNDGAPCRLIDVEGLGLPKTDFSVTGYANQPGQVLISQKDAARSITLSFDIVSKMLQNQISRIAKILYRAGTLTIISGNKKKTIAARCTDFGEAKRHGKNIATIVAQFTCDNPYFTDESTRKLNLFQRKNLLKTTFTLPCALSSRTNRLTAVNMGDVRTEPIFIIYSSSNVAPHSETYGIKIINHTTRQSILLLRHTESGETITIDIPNRKITSSTAGDITAAISQDTFLSNFWLDEGANDIEVVNYNEGEDISIVMEYSNQYLEAVR